MVGAFDRGLVKNRETHALLVQLFAMQVECGFKLSLKVDSDRRERGRGCSLAAATRIYHSHTARSVQSNTRRDGPA